MVADKQVQYSPEGRRQFVEVLLRRGAHLVPCDPTMTPVCNWPDDYVSPHRIREWVAGDPFENLLAVRPASIGCTVLDVRPVYPRTFVADTSQVMSSVMQRLRVVLPYEIVSTTEVRTPRGGCHIWIYSRPDRHDKDYRTKIRDFGGNPNILEGQVHVHNYVVLWDMGRVVQMITSGLPGIFKSNWLSNIATIRRPMRPF